MRPYTQVAEPYLGVTYYQFYQPSDAPASAPFPRELAIHLVEIDVSAPGISFLGTPGNGAAEYEYRRQTTSSFVSSNGLAVGINGDFYTIDTGINADVAGLGVSNGQFVSPPGPGASRNSLVTFADQSAQVLTSSTLPPGVWNAVSGNQRIVEAGFNVAPNDDYTNSLNPHTAVGVDAESGNVWFMVVDGRQAGFSRGMRTSEMADLFIDFGVDNAINLDGGGSSTLVFADGLNGAPRTINRPSDGATSQQPGYERSVANHFGVMAIPNPAYVPLPPPGGVASEAMVDFEGPGYTPGNVVGQGGWSATNYFPTRNGTVVVSDAGPLSGSQSLTYVRTDTTLASNGSDVVKENVVTVTADGTPAADLKASFEISSTSLASQGLGYGMSGLFLSPAGTSGVSPIGIMLNNGGSTIPSIEEYADYGGSPAWHYFGGSLDAAAFAESDTLQFILNVDFDTASYTTAYRNLTTGGPLVSSGVTRGFAIPYAPNPDGTYDVDVVAAFRYGAGSLDNIRLTTATATAGDYNGDGVVDAADYTVWRDGLGTVYAPSDYGVWAANYDTAAVATSTGVPEPKAGLLAALAALTVVWRPRG